MDITRLERGPRMSQAVIHGNTVYLAGQVGNPSSDLAGQIREALALVDEKLAAAGTDKSRLLQVTVWLADISDFAEMNGIYEAWIDPDNPPARACAEAKLATPDYLVEFIVTAAR